MKKLIGIVAALAVFFALQACGEGDDPAPGIRLSTETLDFPAGKSTLDLVVSCPQQWRLRVSAGWCYVLGADVLNEPCEGKTFKVGVDGNNALKGREALITLTGADGTVKTVTVTQGAAEELSPVIESFRFRTAANAAKLPQDVVLEVGDGIISGRTSFVVENKVLVPEFEFEGEGVYMGSQEIASGETEVDFSGPVVLTVRSKGGEEREYRVSLVSFTGLPVVYIDTGGIPVVSKEEYVAASLKVVDNNGLRPSGVFRGDVNIKGRGNSTWGMPKKPYRLKFDKKQSLLGEPKDNKVDAIFIPHCNFGTEDSVARIAREVGKPTLLWGPRDEAPLPDGQRLRDTQCDGLCDRAPELSGVYADDPFRRCFPQ